MTMTSEIQGADIAAGVPTGRRNTHRRSDDSIGWLEASLTDLAGHIQRRYHDPLRIELPRLLAMIAEVEMRHGARHGERLTPLRHIFDRLSRALLIHMRKEDAVLFPAIVAIEAAFTHASGVRPWTGIAEPVELLEADHADARDAFAGLRLLTRGYAAPDDACSTFRELCERLAELERDMLVHVHLENHVLFPRAVALARMLEA
jgi:regulator of cell morphogenesis and NO signaling